MISNEYIAKIEGHGNLSVNWDENTVKLNIHEGERLFEGILVGRTAEEMHWITPRICGVCPIAHNLASLAAVEDAYGIKISETSRILRELMKCGQMIQSHVLHLFFLVLPDYVGIDRGTELVKKDPESFAKALALKEIGDEIAYVVAGRNVHPTTTAIGGFHKIPTKEEIDELGEKLEKTEKEAVWAASLFSGLKYPSLVVDLEMVSQRGDDIVSLKGDKTPIKEYKKNIEEELREYSTAKFGKYRGKEMFVGALARLANLGENLINDELGNFVSKLDFQNPFHNNIAQGIEIAMYHNYARELVERLLASEFVEARADLGVKTLPPSQDQEFSGTGAVEAPRGGLYHEIRLDENGIISYANIITPTVQNLTSIEKSAQALLEQTKTLEQKGEFSAVRKERERLLNMLVRAYDPCITCSVH